MRQALNDVFIAFGVPVPTYTDGQTLLAGTIVKAIHIQELRNFVGVIE